MSKLSLDALKERAEATASTELISSISGGTENSCHDSTWTMTIDFTCSENPCGTNSGGVDLGGGVSFSQMLQILGGVKIW